MKRFNVFITVSAFILILFSCEQQETLQTKPTTKENSLTPFIIPDSVVLSVEKGRLVFEDEASLQTCMNYLNTLTIQELDKFETAIGYVSYRSAPLVKSEKVYDELFATLLNPECKIQVGNYIITTNLEEENTTITPIHSCMKSSSFNLDKEITIDWLQDAFVVIETGQKQVVHKGYCGNTDRKKEWEHEYGNSMHYSRLQAKVCFQRAGWYNSIIVKFKLEAARGNHYRYYLNYESTPDSYVKPRKRGRAGINVKKSNYWATASQNEISDRPYQSTRRVEDSKVSVDFSFDAYIMNGPYAFSDNIRLTMSCS